VFFIFPDLPIHFPFIPHDLQSLFPLLSIDHWIIVAPFLLHSEIVQGHRLAHCRAVEVVAVDVQDVLFLTELSGILRNRLRLFDRQVLPSGIGMKDLTDSSPDTILHHQETIVADIGIREVVKLEVPLIPLGEVRLGGTIMEADFLVIEETLETFHLAESVQAVVTSCRWFPPHAMVIAKTLPM